MKTIGHRKQGIDIFFIIFAIIGLIVIAVGFYYLWDGGYKAFSTFLMGFGILIISIFVLVEYYKSPKELILNNDKIEICQNNKFEIGQNKKIKISDINDVSYKKSSGRGFQYNWGKVSIRTSSEVYIIKYLADCEGVAKKITSLMYSVRENE